MSNSKMVMDDSSDSGGGSGSGKGFKGLLFGLIILIAALVYFFYPSGGTDKDASISAKPETELSENNKDSVSKNITAESVPESKQTEPVPVIMSEDGSQAEKQASFENYTIQTGDCLWSIASKNPDYNSGFKWTEIYEMNKQIIDNPDLIYPGQKIKVK